ncbi:DUF4439 domain-containing protein [Actinotalea sp. JY-7876]|uniref:DUF4439 domain-containing protein n=1 Tax=Actinotalea sp. JY-7876 TaxID=2758442 RepID=UPI0015F5EC55|nr:DUF4439 domain-containing protein [Actinotalea sp. JY-7876]
MTRAPALPAPVTRPHRRTRPLVAVLAVVLVTILAGCGLRLETPAPVAPSPDAAESLRQRATADALAVQVLASAVATAATDPTVQALATTTGTASDAHVEALGGVYEPFPDATAAPESPETAEPSDDAAPSDDAEPSDDAAPSDDEPVTPDDASSAAPTAGATPPTPTAAELVALLDETAASARADAATTDDGGLARLLASIAVGRTLLADALAGPAAVTERPALELAPVEGLPAGVSAADVNDVVQSEDALGYAWEVAAARRSGDARAAAAAAARDHRERAETWATAAGVAATDSDPRRVAYGLPPALLDAASDPAAVDAELAGLQERLTASYASLVAQAAPQARTVLVDALLAAARATTALTGVVPAFPGLPEQLA